MSIQVNDFRWEPGKNDAEYIKLLESSRDEWQRIAQKAIAKLKMLSKAQEPVEPIQKASKHGWFFYCPKCETILNDMAEPKYCSECGQAVKW